MGFFDSSPGPAVSNGDEGASLTTVLDTPALRVELALLCLLCADSMRNELLATFDPDKMHDPNAKNMAKASTQQQVPDLLSFDLPEPRKDPDTLATESSRQSRVQEIESTQMQALRRSGLTFLDKWRAAVLNRVCEVLCLRSAVVRQAKAKKNQEMRDAERAKQGNSLLIDFGSDPFGDSLQSAGKDKQGPYEVIDTKLAHLDMEKRILVLHCMLLLLLSLEQYTAHSRILLVRLAASLGIEQRVLVEHEKAVAQGLLQSAASQMDAEEATKKQAVSESASRKWKIGLAAVGGAVLIGVTGGLAAPLLAAGVGSVMGGLGLGAISGLLGTLAGSSVLVGSLFGAYGGKMTGRLMRQYAGEVKDFEFIPVQGEYDIVALLHLSHKIPDTERRSSQDPHEWSDEQHARDPTKREQHRLRVAIGVSGWLNSPVDVNKPWEVLDPNSTEPFSLRFELDAMLRMGNSLNDVLLNYAWDGITYTIVSRTLLGALYAGLWPLGLVKAASVLDNPFSVAVARADKAGKVMARALIDKVQGERPVTLLGYSIGARVVYSCLVELADQHAFGLVESVILMGTPAPSDSLAWRKIRSVVTGRVVNVYSKEDYILGFLYRSTKLQIGVAGLEEVKDVHGVENVDMSALVPGHDKYKYLVGTICNKVGFGDVDFSKFAEKQRAMEAAEQQKKQGRQQASERNSASQKPGALARPPNSGMVNPSSQPQHGNLIDDSPPTSAPATTATLPMRMPMMMQQRSGQQPMRSAMNMAQMRAIQPEPASSLPKTQPRVPGEKKSTTPATLTRVDPVTLKPIESTPASVSNKRAAFPMVSAASRGNRQAPSNMVPTPRAPPQQTNFTVTATAAVVAAAETSDSEDKKADKIYMVDADVDQKQRAPRIGRPKAQSVEAKSASLKPGTAYLSGTIVLSPISLIKTADITSAVQTADVSKLIPSVTVQEVEGDDFEEDEEDDYSDSEFGELSMVEPVPLDDGDMGLLA